MSIITNWIRTHKKTTIAIIIFLFSVIGSKLFPNLGDLSAEEKKELKEQYQTHISSRFDGFQESYSKLVESYGLLMKHLGDQSISVSGGYELASGLEDLTNMLLDQLDAMQPVENMSDDQIKIFREVKNDYYDALISWIAICRDMQKMLDKGEFSNRKFEDIQIQLDNATACSVSAIQNKKKLDAMIDEIN